MDYNLIKIKEYTEAEKFKHEMEELQRKEKKNRAEAEKKRGSPKKKAAK